MSLKSKRSCPSGYGDVTGGTEKLRSNGPDSIRGIDASQKVCERLTGFEAIPLQRPINHELTARMSHRWAS